ncbi:Arm DNA-binding domain-containing protein [Yoonia sediminilitoris]|uniref:Integrase DNA-binding domain-containing protein n=1 Tax=Yoonia sediminilitoris TaxID=1286148 RepID=A0A2T6KC56_9RHOB|nr:Arm DNA-binding domain-containing protein [Yoonia sediminilitoris]PUB12463.1 hypothetical protein C8N45_110102 [Yoonia sediminilitoris]RCW93157.1 hypothetical protein DFP92_110102 [Yoonia sediminilitoris]
MLTVKQIEAARYGVSPVRLSDGNSLYVRLNKGGGKRFQLRLTEGTRTRWVTLGRYPELHLRDPRVQAVLTKTGYGSADKPSPTYPPTRLRIFRNTQTSWPHSVTCKGLVRPQEKGPVKRQAHQSELFDTQNICLSTLSKLQLDEIR